MHQRPISLAKLRKVPQQFSWVDQRLSLTSAELRQARQALITLGLVAYQRPLYQVLALDAGPIGPPPSASPEAADDDSVDIKAIFARIWEVLA